MRIYHIPAVGHKPFVFLLALVLSYRRLKVLFPVVLGTVGRPKNAVSSRMENEYTHCLSRGSMADNLYISAPNQYRVTRCAVYAVYAPGSGEIGHAPEPLASIAIRIQ